MLADDGLHMRFPEVEIREHSAFKSWYKVVTRRVFDERHEVQPETLVCDVAGLAIDFVVGWQASWWEPGEARGHRVAMDAVQRWTVRASTASPVGL